MDEIIKAIQHRQDQLKIHITNSFTKADDGKGHWVTSEDGNHIFIGGDGSLNHTREQISAAQNPVTQEPSSPEPKHNKKTQIVGSKGNILDTANMHHHKDFKEANAEDHTKIAELHNKLADEAKDRAVKWHHLGQAHAHEKLAKEKSKVNDKEPVQDAKNDPVSKEEVPTQQDAPQEEEEKQKELDKKEIKPVETPEEVSAIINNVTPETRVEAALDLFGKEADEESEAEKIEKRVATIKKEATVKQFTTQSGETVYALDYSHVVPEDIQLVKEKDILTAPKPYWCPDINEKDFDRHHLLSFTKHDNNGNLLISLNGYNPKHNIQQKPVSGEYDKGYNEKSHFAVVSLDQFVAIQDYYIKKKKAEANIRKKEDMNSALDWVKRWNEANETKYYPFDYQRRLSDAQKKKYTESEWNALSRDEKIAEIPNMKYPAIKLPSSKRIKPVDANKMPYTITAMYNKFRGNNQAQGLSNVYRSNPSVTEYLEIRKLMGYKANDLTLQREEDEGSYKKGLETSWGDSGTKDDLLSSHGVKIKLQNGKDIKADHIEQIKDNLDAVYNSFGNRSSLAKKFGLKISHSGEKLMFARKALGIYIPCMKTIGVSNNQEHDKFGFTMAHEISHWLDNSVGVKMGRRFMSDDYESVAGRIANEFRDNMNKSTDNDYLNRTCECFARAMEQYHAMKTEGEDAVKSKAHGVPYHKSPEHVSKDKFNDKIKPLIEQFLKDNDHLLKSLQFNII